MSDALRALILGIVQGLTEFLPVSSSGHLEIANELIGSNQAIDSDLMMVIIVHLGTALSILYVYRQDVWRIITDVLGWRDTEHRSLAMQILLSMIPALIIGLLMEEYLDRLFSGSIVWVGVFLLVTAVVLYLTPSGERSGSPVGYRSAGLIGIAQAVAVLPGVSRSGMTIASALALGVDRESAARFSFLMVLPVILGKVLLDVVSGDMVLSAESLPSIGIALVSSFLVGVWACRWMVQLVKSSGLRAFAYYCAAVGLLTIGYHFAFG